MDFEKLKNMDLDELKQKLTELGVREDSYTFIDDRLANECYCLIRSGLKWEVFYAEKGNKNILATFDSEFEACDYFYSVIITDSAVMSNLKKNNLPPVVAFVQRGF